MILNINLQFNHEHHWFSSLYLCGNSTLHHTDIEVRRSSFVHLNAAVGDHKHSLVRKLDISCSQRLEVYQLCLAEQSVNFLLLTTKVIRVEKLKKKQTITRGHKCFLIKNSYNVSNLVLTRSNLEFTNSYLQTRQDLCIVLKLFAVRPTDVIKVNTVTVGDTNWWDQIFNTTVFYIMLLKM